VLLLSTAQGHWGSLFAQNVPAGGLADLEIEVIPDALVTEIATALETTADTNKGIVAVVFDEDTAVGGENAEISVTNELSFVFNEAEEPEEGSTLIAGGGAEVIFINTDVASPVTATAASAGAQSCPPEFPGVAYSVRAKVLTEIEVVCPVP
jgi:hypothetical protein